MNPHDDVHQCIWCQAKGLEGGIFEIVQVEFPDNSGRKSLYWIHALCFPGLITHALLSITYESQT